MRWLEKNQDNDGRGKNCALNMLGFKILKA